VSIKTPRLILDRCGVFYFRWIVPLTWREAVGRTEIRRSLGTKDASLARQSALLLSARMEAAMAAKKSAEKAAGKGRAAPMAAAERQARAEVMAVMQEAADEAAVAYKMKARFYPDGSSEIEADTLEEAKEARAMAEAHARARIAEAEARKAAAAGTALAALPSSLCGTHLRAAADDYIQERSAALNEKGTMPKIKGALAAFIAFAGNADVGMVKAAKVKAYKKSMLDGGKAGTTINDHISALNGFFEWCIGNGVANMSNPAKGLQIVGAHAKAQPYKPYSDEELASIFASGPYLERMDLPDFYWGPLIALWTGARAEEIASLECRQIRQERGVWIIGIEKGKTENAARKVPIHSKLLGLGLVEYRDAISEAGHKRLFPHLVDGKNGYRKNMCRIFGVHLDSPEVDIKDPLKVFHSFRHTAITKLTSENVNDGLKKALVGHDIDSKDTAHDGYIHGAALTLQALRDAIEKLDFPTVDASALQLQPGHFLPTIAKRIEQGKARSAKKALKEKAKAGKPAASAA